MRITKIHRKYPKQGWEFKALSTRVDGRDIVFGKYALGKKRKTTIEVYGGKNYIVGSTAPSYSRLYTPTKVPKSLMPIVKKLMVAHRKTKWSTAKRVNLN